MELNKFTKNIDQFKEKCFIIPNYQRGYRWEAQQVLDLLNDIWEFANRECSSNISEFYCLQPLIVKNIADDTYEVVDGQQRITTIFLILQYFKDPKFSISYDTKEDVKYNSMPISYSDFLADVSSQEQYHKLNADFYHIYNAYKVIVEWFENKAKVNGEIKYKFPSVLLSKTRVIWFEIDSLIDSIRYFIRLNSMKIPLTNAELIKALLLQQGNYGDKKYIREGIARDWDMIEKELQNHDFWCFLTGETPNGASSYNTRIDWLFEIALKVHPDDFNNFDAKNTKKNDPYISFRQYNSLFYDENGAFINQNDRMSMSENIWDKVKSVFLTVQEWFEDKGLYHRIAYLNVRKLSNKAKISHIPNLIHVRGNKGYDEFLDYLDTLIEKDISLYITDKDTKQLRLLQFSNNNQTEKDKIFDTLLWCNVKECLKKNSYMQFPFARFLEEEWSIEHIHAQNSQDSQEQRKSIVKESLSYPLSEKQHSYLKNQCNQLLQKSFTQEELKHHMESIDDTEELEKIESIVLSIFGEYTQNIGNLALLTKDVNSALGNGMFPSKKEKLIEKDQGGEFIPPLTKMIFLKYFNTTTDNNVWGKEDQDSYIEYLETIVRNK